MQSMNGVLDAEPDAQAAFNLVLCTFALGDKEMMKQAFSRLVEVSSLLQRLDCFRNHVFLDMNVVLATLGCFNTGAMFFTVLSDDRCVPDCF